MAQKQKRQDRAVEALLTCGTISEAATTSGVPRRTLSNWLRNDSDFRDRLREERNRTHMLAVCRIVHATNDAVDVVLRGLRGEGVSKMQFLCAKQVLEGALAAQQMDVDSRLAEIEQQLRTLAEPLQ